MAYFNRFKDVEIKLNDVQQKHYGEFKIVAFQGFEFPKGSGRIWKYPGTERVLQDWCPNLVTNNGLDSMGGGGAFFQAQYCHVGTGNVPPAYTDTSLGGYVATDQLNDKTPSAQSTPPYYGMTESRYLFSPNFGGGNINLNEIGVSQVVDETALTARALTVDAFGTPTTISVLSTEYLECYYRRRNYPAHIVEATGAPTDDTGTVNIEGVNYGYTIRPSVVTYGGSYTVGTGIGWGTFMFKFDTAVGYTNDIFAEGIAYKSDMTLGAVTSAPGGTKHTSSSETSAGIGAYTTGTYSQEAYWSWGIDRANDVGGIGGLVIKTRFGAYQIKFDTPVPKVYGQVFTFYHNFSWARKETWV